MMNPISVVKIIIAIKSSISYKIKIMPILKEIKKVTTEVNQIPKFN